MHFMKQKKAYLEVSGLEPLTSALQRQRSTNWAIPPEPLKGWAILDSNQGPHPYQGCALTSWANSPPFSFFLKKEVIQPHLPVRLPCYDFTLVTSSALGIPLPKVRVTTLGIASSHGVTGGVYKARERIHRSMADLRLLAIPPSCRRVAACNPNWDWVFEVSLLSRVRISLSQPL